jgi:hypothetical protein
LAARGTPGEINPALIYSPWPNGTTKLQTSAEAQRPDASTADMGRCTSCTIEKHREAYLSGSAPGTLLQNAMRMAPTS